jgi:hypothetical protein
MTEVCFELGSHSDENGWRNYELRAAFTEAMQIESMSYWAYDQNGEVQECEWTQVPQYLLLTGHGLLFQHLKSIGLTWEMVSPIKKDFQS